VRSTDWFWIKQEDSCDNLINPRRPADNREGAAIIAYGAGALWHGLRTGTPGRLFLDQFGATRYARWRTTCVSMNASRCQEVPTASENALPQCSGGQVAAGSNPVSATRIFAGHRLFLSVTGHSMFDRTPRAGPRGSTNRGQASPAPDRPCRSRRTVDRLSVWGSLNGQPIRTSHQA
jgi:hypothetical protein